MGVMMTDEAMEWRDWLESIKAALLKVRRYFFPARVALMTDSEREVTREWETRVMIVCGNCAGAERVPRKTMMSIDGRCGQCGSASFVNAAQFSGRVK